MKTSSSLLCFLLRACTHHTFLMSAAHIRPAFSSLVSISCSQWGKKPLPMISSVDVHAALHCYNCRVVRCCVRLMLIAEYSWALLPVSLEIVQCTLTFCYWQEPTFKRHGLHSKPHKLSVSFAIIERRFEKYSLLVSAKPSVSLLSPPPPEVIRQQVSMSSIFVEKCRVSDFEIASDQAFAKKAQIGSSEVLTELSDSKIRCSNRLCAGASLPSRCWSCQGVNAARIHSSLRWDRSEPNSTTTSLVLWPNNHCARQASRHAGFAKTFWTNYLRLRPTRVSTCQVFCQLYSMFFAVEINAGGTQVIYLCADGPSLLGVRQGAIHAPLPCLLVPLLRLNLTRTRLIFVTLLRLQ